MKKILTLLILMLGISGVQAQNLGYGFKAGLNFNRFNTDNIRPGEEFVGVTGFHIGAVFGYKFTDLTGMRAELLYSVRGGRIRYDNTNNFENRDAFLLTAESGQEFIITGLRQSTLRINNSYIEIPLTFYYKPAKWLEFSVGAQAGVRVASTGLGQMIVNGRTELDGQEFDVQQLNFNLEYDFGKDSFEDEVIGAGFIDLAGERVLVPGTLNAYSEFDEDYGELYETLDYQLIGGMSLFLNQGLFLGGRVNVGLKDVTRNEADRINLITEDGTGIESRVQNDIDKNFAVQVSIGFIF